MPTPARRTGPRASYARLIVAALVACIGALTGAQPASAQSGKTIALGGGVAHYRPVADDAHASTGFAFVYRLGRPEGWRPAIGLNWFNTKFDTRVAGDEVGLGELRVRPIMGGYGYTVRRGRLAATGSAVGGVAFNSFKEADAVRLAYAQLLDRTLLRISAGNSLAARGEISLWWDLNERLGLLGVVGYVVARPTISIVSDTGTEERRLKADSVKLQIGIAYGIF
jgi:hypothetical protein